MALFRREKDALWQKNDALEFEQKLRDEETERDVNQCVGCHTQFSWFLHKYNCRSLDFQNRFSRKCFILKITKKILLMFVCFSPDCVGVRSATTAAVTRSALSLAAAESAAACTVTISTARCLSATRRRK